MLLFVIWEVAVRVTGIKEYLLPPPSKVWTEFWKRHAIVVGGAWVTTQEILAGYALAVVVSIPLALAVAYSRFMEQAVYPVIVFLQIVPKIAIAPLFIIWFGFGFTPKLLLVFLLSFFPIVVSSIAGLQECGPRRHGLRPHDGRRAAADVHEDQPAAGAAAHLHRPEGGRRACRDRRRGRRVRRVRQGPRLPAAAIQRQLDTPMVFATIVILSLIGLAVYYAVEIVERLAIPWHVSQQATARDATL